jgi:hypothetical protein
VPKGCTYTADSCGKGNTIVSRECPSLPTRSSNARDDTPRQREDDEHRHGDRRRFAPRRVVKDGQERPAVGRVRDVCHVSPRVHERDDHEEAEESVDVGRVHDCSGDGTGGVLCLFSHVDLAVESEKAQSERQEADHE